MPVTESVSLVKALSLQFQDKTSSLAVQQAMANQAWSYSFSRKVQYSLAQEPWVVLKYEPESGEMRFPYRHAK